MELLSFVIPCYRSEKSISSVVNEIRQTVLEDGRYDYEIICVNDGSPDNTLNVLDELAEQDEKVIVIDLTRNFGQHSAIMAGFNNVSGDIIVCLDDDGQTPPCEMFKLIDKLNEGYDLVSAKYPKKKQSPFRRIGAGAAKIMGELLVNKPKNVQLNSYYAVRRFVVDETIKYRNAYPYVIGLELRITRNIADVEVNQREREYGSSGYSFIKLLGLWLNGFTAFSEKPLRIASVIGLLCAFIGFVFGVIVVVQKLINPDVLMGYSSLMAAMLFLFGIVFIILGLIGEYIGKIYICLNNAPQYAVRSIKNRKQNNKDELRS